MAIYYPPPPPFMGGAQPHVPRKLPPAIIAVEVDNPPTTLGGPIAILASIIAAWQPNPWVYGIYGPKGGQPYAANQIAPGIPGQSIDRPPVQHPARSPQFAAIIAAWQPNPWVYDYFGVNGSQPYAPRRLPAVLLAVQVSVFPFQHPGRSVAAAEIVAQWQPPIWPYAFEGYMSPYTPNQSRWLTGFPQARSYVVILG